MKIHFFATAVVLAFYSAGCDASGDQVASGDAGAPPVFPTGEPHCQVPTPKVPRQGLSTTPRGGYQWLANYPSGFACVANPPDSYGVPTNCSDPVDGFSDGKPQKYVDPAGAVEEIDVWCCVSVESPLPGDDPKMVFATSPSLACDEYVQGGFGTGSAYVALCSPSGVFVGWRC